MVEGPARRGRTGNVSIRRRRPLFRAGFSKGGKKNVLQKIWTRGKVKHISSRVLSLISRRGGRNPAVRGPLILPVGIGYKKSTGFPPEGERIEKVGVRKRYPEASQEASA